ncbi:hypothetical protein WDZ92_40345 [Nostoc sp. NIES-2111]
MAALAGGWALVAAAGAQAADLPSRAAEPPPSAVAPIWTWRFTFTAYGWATALDGSVGVGRLPAANVDVGFDDILNKLDGAFMGAAFAQNGTFLLGADLIWSKLGDNVSFKIGDGPLADQRNGAVAKLSQTMTIATAIAGYRIPIGPPELEMYGTVGARYQRLSASINTFRDDPRFDRYASRSADWVDPIVGVVINYRINEKWYVNAIGDVGGFSVGSNLTAQGLFAVGYNWTANISTALGYRALYTDYEKNNDRGGSFRYDTTMHGPFATLSFHF